MSFKKLVGKLHLWLGLGSGLVVFLVSTTGCILAFEEEIKSVTLPFIYAEPQKNAPLLPPSALIARSEAAMNGREAHTIYYYEEGKSTVVRFITKKPKSVQQVYLNPYTGEVLKVWDIEDDFFRTIFNGHFNLWIPRPVGSYIVSYATLLFSILLITGIILWWPKKLKKSTTDKSFKIKWKAKWRRVNYDLHNVPGFYVFFIALTLAITGMTFGIEWFNDGVYKIASLGNSKVEKQTEPLSDTTLASNYSKIKIMDALWLNAMKKHGRDGIISITNPAERSKPIAVSINPAPGTYYKSSTAYFDQHTGKKFTGKNLFGGHSEELAFGRFLHNLSYDIHVGAIAGLPGKILAFIASFVCASLPVSGFIIWWGRKKKEQKGFKAKTRKAAGPLKNDLLIY